MKNRLLFKASHFSAAIENKWRITVYQHDVILDEGGVIELQTLKSVKINGSYYIKKNCQFVLAGGNKVEDDIAEFNKYEASKIDSREILFIFDNRELSPEN
ncbi:hypothetical protein MHB77_08800 [Paenibacillus sp. FSL K6-3166]|uniref:hypothetical protein n=1 Tax=unclassified Paenibacillus TaxID=185978 RepID=UPI000B9FD1E1|nr:hypothetical protein [Paenibacillus sp. VTT E-133291]MBY3618622.1 hypothetical protein [Acinetobacter sp. CUI P1]OZQ97256.1 hypothetical protein CA598_06785 [Paenibacillus sp. VTT E-133291]